MKVISYSLFNGNKEPFEKMAYIRGFYFNVRMNRLIYPDWNTVVSIDFETYTKYERFFDSLGVITNVIGYTPALCEGMLWRMLPIWSEGVTHVLCRDSDAITTYKEAQLVETWLNSGKGVHAIHDNPAHGGLMGGMVGFKTEVIKQHFQSWEEMVIGNNLSRHGSDQHLLNQKIEPKVSSEILWHRQEKPENKLPGVDHKLWESNLTCRHIGSAGVVEMETLRFFKRFDKKDYSQLEKENSDICYWTR